jgi:hypothetical protein
MAALLAWAAAPKVNAGDTPDGQPGWDREKAAQYLDDRMDLWFAKATKLKTGEGQTSCISCHTVVPYLLARPALRKAMGVNSPTPQETKLLDEITQRVDTFDSHQPLYEQKEKQSRGTEAVLNLLILAGADARERRQQPSGPAGKALHQLLEEQRPDGAWDWLDSALEPNESADARYGGAALAAFALGSVPGLLAAGQGDGHITRLCAYLNGNYAGQNLYNRAWLLLASTRLRDLLGQEQRATAIADLKGRQNDDGGWSLYGLGPWRWSKTTPQPAPGGNTNTSLLAKSDGYATGLIAYVLHQAGLPANDPGLKRATDWLKANQQECQIDQQHWKCWRSHSLNYDRENGGARGEPFKRMVMSDLATAFAVLALSPPD